MIGLLAMVLLTVALAVWVVSRRDPLWLAIHGLIWTRAAIMLAAACIVAAWKSYTASLPTAARMMRAEIGER